MSRGFCPCHCMDSVGLGGGWTWLLFERLSNAGARVPKEALLLHWGPSEGHSFGVFLASVIF